MLTHIDTCEETLEKRKEQIRSALRQMVDWQGGNPLNGEQTASPCAYVRVTEDTHTQTISIKWKQCYSAITNQLQTTWVSHIEHFVSEFRISSTVKDRFAGIYKNVRNPHIPTGKFMPCYEVDTCSLWICVANNPLPLLFFKFSGCGFNSHVLIHLKSTETDNRVSFQFLKKINKGKNEEIKNLNIRKAAH